MSKNDEFDEEDGDLDDLDDIFSPGTVDPDNFDPIYNKAGLKEESNIDYGIEENNQYSADDEENSEKDVSSVKNRKRPQKRHKKKRNFKETPILNPSFDLIQQCKVKLNDYYDNNPQFLKGKNKDEKISEVINACKTGWLCAPKDFIKRLVWKTKCQSLEEISEDDKESINRARYQLEQESQLKADIAEAELKDVYKHFSAKLIRDVLPDHELKFWLEREAEYRREFDFNNSSDYTLLYTALLEELTHYRLMLRRMQDPYESMDWELSESLKRLTIAQEKLGVTRVQREREKEGDNLNIALMALNLDKKIRMMKKREENYLKQEEALQAAHDDGSGLESLNLPEDLAAALKKAIEEEDVLDLSIDEMIEKEDSIDV